MTGKCESESEFRKGTDASHFFELIHCFLTDATSPFLEGRQLMWLERRRGRVLVAWASQGFSCDVVKSKTRKPLFHEKGSNVQLPVNVHMPFPAGTRDRDTIHKQHRHSTSYDWHTW
jgi:hypothetical protein